MMNARTQLLAALQVRARRLGRRREVAEEERASVGVGDVGGALDRLDDERLVARGVAPHLLVVGHGARVGHVEEALGQVAVRMCVRVRVRVRVCVFVCDGGEKGRRGAVLRE